MITRRDLARALARRNVSDWLVVERTQELAIADAARGTQRRETRHRMTLLVHHDESRGRGSARLELAGLDVDANAVVEQAIDLATAAIGPSWKSVATAAPAKVDLVDPQLPKRKLDDVAASLARRVGRVAGVTADLRAEVMLEQVTTASRAGLTARWAASRFHADVMVSDGERSLAIARTARLEDDLDLDHAIGAAAVDLRELASATPIEPGPCALALTAEAFLHGDAPAGVWSVFARQADAVLERQGLTRYRVGAPVTPGAELVDEPLSVTSDGALRFGLRSAPIGDDGDAVRRFAIVDRGIAKGLGLSPREAALRQRDPNGGVRNLVVAPGTWDGALPAAGSRGPLPRTVEVRRLRALAIDPYTGEASLELALSIEHAATRRAFIGGTVRLDLVDALARARRSAAVIRRDAYVGPATILIESAELVR